MATVAATIAIGIPALLLSLWPLLRRRVAFTSEYEDQAWAELEAEKALMLRAIRELDLDHQAGHFADDDYAGLRAQYETRAALVLKRLDALGPARARAQASRADHAPAPLPAIPWSRQPLVLTGAALGLVAFGVILGLLVVRYTGPAPPDMTAQAPLGPVLPALPGPTGEASGAPSPQPIPPGMLAGMLQAARSSLEAGRMQEAIAAYRAVLKRQPDNVDALTHFGLILAMAGHADQAMAFFDRALAVDADYPEALSYSAQARFELKQDYAGAIAAWERFAEVVPSDVARQEALARIEEAKARLADAPPPAKTTPSADDTPGTAEPATASP